MIKVDSVIPCSNSKILYCKICDNSCYFKNILYAIARVYIAIVLSQNNILRCKLTVRKTEPLRNSICGLQRSRIAFKRISRTNGRLLAITVYRADKQLYEHLPFRY